MFSAALPGIAVATAVFTAIHLGVGKRVEANFSRAFKLSRGVAAVTLTLVGTAGLLIDLPNWRQAFLVRHPEDSVLRWGVILAYGHLVSDFIWMAWGRWRAGVVPRTDLLIHHGLGALAYAYALEIQVGYGLVMLSLASELMPCFTGLEAWGKHKERDAVVRRAARARLVVLLSWRIPLWTLALVLCVLLFVDGRYPAELRFPLQFSIACLVMLLGLDLYWVRKCLPAWRPAM